MNEKKKKLIRQVLALFNLGDGGRNNSEEEALAAVTKAKTLMAEYDITRDELEAFGTEKARQVAVLVREESAWTIKRKSFAAYDQAIANAVDVICGTANYVRQFSDHRGSFVSRHFIGDDVDVAVACALFNALMTQMKRMATSVYGRGKWSTPHSSYCIGFSNRVLTRAREWKLNLPEEAANRYALVVRSKEVAIADYRTKLGLVSKTLRKQRIDRSAFNHGYRDGEAVAIDRPRKYVG